jgi:hypothetical protein
MDQLPGRFQDLGRFAAGTCCRGFLARLIPLDGMTQ